MHSNPLPLVSAVIPTYNRSSLLRRALAAIAKQTYPNIEVVISDNGSTDDTPLVCAEFAAEYPKCTLHRFPANRGIVTNMQHSISLAKGEFLAMCGDDDFWMPDFIAQLVEQMRLSPKAVVAMSATQRIFPDGTFSETIDLMPFNNISRRQQIRSLITKKAPNGGRAKNNYFIFGLFRREPWVRFTTQLPANDLRNERHIMAIAACWGPFIAIEKPLFYKTFHQTKLSARYPDDEYLKARTQLTSLAAVRRSTFLAVMDKHATLKGKLYICLAILEYLTYLGWPFLVTLVPAWARPRLRTMWHALRPKRTH